MVVHPLNPSTMETGRQISVSVRLASSACEIPGRPELRRETVSKQWFEDEDQNK